MTPYIEGLMTGAWRLVPVERVKPLEWEENKSAREKICKQWLSNTPFGTIWIEHKKKFWISSDGVGQWRVYHETLEHAKAAAQADYEARILSALSASPDATSALLAEIEGLRGALAELEGLVGRIAPHVDAIVCYASSMGEHEPNRIAHEVRAVAGRTQDRLVGEAIAAQIIARIDAAHPAPHEETGWLVELKGQTPSWSTIFAGDYDDHWTEDSTKAIRFARKVDAEAWIAWHGWTEVFASEHIWSDGRARATKDQPDV